MLHVPLFRQTPGYCGPASLKMVLGYYGVEESEKALAKAAGSTWTHGTSAKGIVKAAKAYGCKARIEDNATIGKLRIQLKRGIPVIVNWFSVDGGHYSVVIGMNKKSIHLADPERTEVLSMDLATFLGVWFDFHGPYPKTKKDMILRRMIVVEPKKRTRQ